MSIPFWQCIPLAQLEGQIQSLQLIPVSQTERLYILIKTQNESYLFLHEQDHNLIRKIELNLPFFYGVSDGLENIYFFTCQDKDDFQNYQYQVYKFEILSENIEALTYKGQPPKQKQQFHSIYYQECLIIFGSASKFSSSNQNILHVLDLNYQEWRTIELEMGIWQIEGQVAAKDGLLYFLKKEQDHKNLVIFDLNSHQQSSIQIDDTLQNDPYNRVFVDAEQDKLYIFDSENLITICLESLQQTNLHRGISLQKIDFSQVSDCVIHGTLFQLAKDQNKQIVLLKIQENELNCEPNPLNFYFNKQEFSDLKFKFDKGELYSNKYLLSFFSKKFKNIFSESEVSVIKISDVNYATFYLMIEQFYYLFQKNLKHDFTILQELLILANKFSIDILQQKCEDSIQINEQNIQSLFDFTQNIHSFVLKKKCIDFFQLHYYKLIEHKRLTQSSVSYLLGQIEQARCSHQEKITFKGELRDVLSVTQNYKQVFLPKSQKIDGVINKGSMDIEICSFCKQVQNYNNIDDIFQ